MDPLCSGLKEGEMICPLMSRCGMPVTCGNQCALNVQIGDGNMACGLLFFVREISNNFKKVKK